MFRDIELILLNEYNLEVLAVTKSSVGAGSDTWFVTCRDGGYV